MGIDDKFIKDVGGQLKPRTSALFLNVVQATTDRVIGRLKQYQPTVLRTSLSHDVEDQLRSAMQADSSALERSAQAQDCGCLNMLTARPHDVVHLQDLYLGLRRDAGPLERRAQLVLDEPIGRFLRLHMSMTRQPFSVWPAVWTASPGGSSPGETSLCVWSYWAWVMPRPSKIMAMAMPSHLPRVPSTRRPGAGSQPVNTCPVQMASSGRRDGARSAGTEQWCPQPSTAFLQPDAPLAFRDLGTTSVTTPLDGLRYLTDLYSGRLAELTVYILLTCGADAPGWPASTRSAHVLLVAERTDCQLLLWYRLYQGCGSPGVVTRNV